MAVSSARITVSTTALALNAADADTTGGTILVVRNQDATNSADLGASGVTAGTGFELKATQTVQVNVPPGEQLYAIRTGAADVRLDVLRFGV